MWLIFGKGDCGSKQTSADDGSHFCIVVSSCCVDNFQDICTALYLENAIDLELELFGVVSFFFFEFGSRGGVVGSLRYRMLVRVSSGTERGTSKE